MLEYVNSGNVALVVALVLAAERLLRLVAPLTETEADDNAVKRLDQARAWVRDKAPLIYLLIEQAKEIGQIVSKKDKPAAFDAELSKAYQNVFGEPLPAKALEEGKVIVKGLAAADKLAALPAPAAPLNPDNVASLANPPAAPSR